MAAPRESEPGSAGDRAVIWARPERAAKGPAPSRSRAEIATAAIKLADADGIEAVSMRRLAQELGIGATSLYSYVVRKDELYDLMLDAVEGEDGGLPPATGDWRADMTTFARRLHALIHRHPWIATLAPRRPTMGPHSLERAERALSALDGLGLGADEMMSITDTIEAYVRGHTIGELAEQEARRSSGLDAQAWMRAQAPYVQSIVASGKYPVLTRVILDARRPHEPDHARQAFQDGLDRILDGFAAHLGGRGQLLR
jgi:AcrR family transcriptional regulator